MRTPFGEIHFIHTLPFYENYVRTGRVDRYEHSNGHTMYRIDGKTLVYLSDGEPRERGSPSPEPSDKTVGYIVRSFLTDPFLARRP